MNGMKQCVCVGFLLSGIALFEQAHSEPAHDDDRVRARDLGIPFPGSPGPFNAITDVEGTHVGQITRIEGGPELQTGQGPVRTGITVVFPQGRDSGASYFAAVDVPNGHGELTGTSWIEELGVTHGPIILTDDKSMGTAFDAVMRWELDRGVSLGIPIIGETSAGVLHDKWGFHITREDVYAALDGADSGPVLEGAVGGGTGMICHGWKGGIGTSSRLVSIGDQEYTVGVLVQCNYGLIDKLRIAGKLVADQIAVPEDHYDAYFAGAPQTGEALASIQIVVGTDAPLLPIQLKRMAKRALAGMTRVGAVWQNGSGDFTIAYSTANLPYLNNQNAEIVALQSSDMAPLMEAVVNATEEAIVNSMVSAKTMTGVEGRTIHALPHDRLRMIFEEKR